QLEERIVQELEGNATLEVAESSDAGPDLESGGAYPEGVPIEADGGSGADDGPLNVDEGSAADDFERLDSFEQANAEAMENEYSAAESRLDRRDDDADLSSYGPRAASGERDAKMDAMANTAAPAASMTDQ